MRALIGQMKGTIQRLILMSCSEFYYFAARKIPPQKCTLCVRRMGLPCGVPHHGAQYAQCVDLHHANTHTHIPTIAQTIYLVNQHFIRYHIRICHDARFIWWAATCHDPNSSAENTTTDDTTENASITIVIRDAYKAKQVAERMRERASKRRRRCQPFHESMCQWGFVVSEKNDNSNNN